TTDVSTAWPADLPRSADPIRTSSSPLRSGLERPPALPAGVFLPIDILSFRRFRRDDLSGLDIEWLCRTLRRGERRHLGTFAQQVDARVNAFRLLDGDALAVAVADEVLHDRDAVGIDAHRLQRL